MFWFVSCFVFFWEKIEGWMLLILSVGRRGRYVADWCGDFGFWGCLVSCVLFGVWVLDFFFLFFPVATTL